MFVENFSFQIRIASSSSVETVSTLSEAVFNEVLILWMMKVDSGKTLFNASVDSSRDSAALITAWAASSSADVSFSPKNLNFYRKILQKIMIRRYDSFVCQLDSIEFFVSRKICRSSGQLFFTISGLIGVII